MSVREHEDVAVDGQRALDHAIRAPTGVVDGLAARRAVLPDAPARPLRAGSPAWSAPRTRRSRPRRGPRRSRPCVEARQPGGHTRALARASTGRARTRGRPAAPAAARRRGGPARSAGRRSRPCACPTRSTRSHRGARGRCSRAAAYAATRHGAGRRVTVGAVSGELTSPERRLRVLLIAHAAWSAVLAVGLHRRRRHRFARFPAQLVRQGRAVRGAVRGRGGGHPALRRPVAGDRARLPRAGRRPGRDARVGRRARPGRARHRGGVRHRRAARVDGGRRPPRRAVHLVVDRRGPLAPRAALPAPDRVPGARRARGGAGGGAARGGRRPRRWRATSTPTSRT